MHLLKSRRSVASAPAGHSNRRKSRHFGVVAVAAAAGLALLAGTSPAYAIANGDPVPDGMYPFSTKLTMTNIPIPGGTFRDSACSAALIAPQWIITAGHCFHDINGNRVSGPVPYPTTATVGRANLLGTGGYVIDVVEVRQAPRADVALGKLASPITDIAPLPLTSAAPKTGAILRVTGWGATSSVNPVPVTRLQTGQVKIKRVTGSRCWLSATPPHQTRVPACTTPALRTSARARAARCWYRSSRTGPRARTRKRRPRPGSTA